MKRYLVNILVFFAVVAAIDICVGCLGDYLQHHSKPGQTKQFDDLCMNDKHDLLIMGSSRAHHHYNARIIEDSLGIDVYNAGYDGNGVIFAYGILQLILERYSPKVIIYDVEPSFDMYIYENDNNRTRYVSTLKRYYRHDGVSDLIKDISMETYLKSYSGMCRYNSVFINSVKDYFIPGKVYDKGYRPLFGTMKNNPAKLPIEKQYVIDSVKIEYLNKFVECCRVNDIRLILVLSPKYGVKQECEVRDILQEISDRNDLVLLDYYDDPYFEENPSLFNEPMHLNNKGAEIYSERICSEMCRLIKKDSSFFGYFQL